MATVRAEIDEAGQAATGMRVGRSVTCPTLPETAAMGAPRFGGGNYAIVARGGCDICFGFGEVRRPDWSLRVCGCAYRGILRACWDQERKVRESLVAGSALLFIEPVAGYGWALNYKTIEYRVDFAGVIERVLPPAERLLWRLHCEEGRPWFECGPRLGMNRGNFFHALYRMQERLGRGLLEAGLYPLAKYFGR
jgi:hypothetical protein